MKEVGVITMHRVINYGSALQAYATQRIIEKLGYKCEIIDYQFPNEFQYQRGYKYAQLTWKNKLAKFLRLKARWRKEDKFNKFYKHYLNLSQYHYSYNEIHNNPPIYDIYMTGSDQVWNPTHTRGDDTFLLGFIPETKNKVSFSASFANKEIPKDYYKLYTKLLSQYQQISVRENNGKEIIKTLLNKEVTVTLDPTLMLNKEEWLNLITPIKKKFNKEQYILIYALNYAFDPSPYIYVLLKELQEKTGYVVYSFTKIPSNFKIRNIHFVNEASPIEFLQIFSNASFIITSSFHGTAFAVNFGIPLISIINNTQIVDDRQSDLLKKLNLNKCIVKKGTPIKDINFDKFQTESGQEKLNKLRQVSLSFLKNALNI